MIYDYDIRKILRRYSPVWFRWSTNLSFAYALCRRLVTLDVLFVRLREDVAQEWQYNGLVHSLEWALNDKFDNVLRRISLTVSVHPMYIYYTSAEQPSFQPFVAAGEPYGYNFLSAQELASAMPYPYEFVIHVPMALGITAKAVFAHTDLYRLAGSRPVIYWHDIFGVANVTYYQSYNPD